MTSLWFCLHAISPFTHLMVNIDCLVVHTRVEHAVKPLNLAQQTLGNQWVGWRQGSCTFKPAFFDQKRV